VRHARAAAGVLWNKMNPYECSPCTPPSTWADMVLFSNLSSPEYIMQVTCPDSSWHQCPGTNAGFHPCLGTSLTLCHLRRSTPPGPLWWLPVGSPS
uniref:Uncharacterized protein n=1 Tax=Xenopus tropicalis TaxID=8364 RepID=A0A6I8R9R5_XENTR